MNPLVKITPKISIGLPVYNGEYYLKKRIDSILNQTYENFELIISDNASTDNTRKICENYVKQDSRIQYIHHKKNNGQIDNFKFLLDNTKEKYFVWAAHDDLWDDTFLLKNIDILESNPSIIGSISEIDFFGNHANRYNSKSTKTLKPGYIRSISGNYFDRVKTAFSTSDTIIYGVYRTDVVRKSFPEKQYWCDGLVFMLNILKFGNFNLYDEILMHRSADGVSSLNRITALKRVGFTNMDIIFMYLPLMKYSLKHFGLKFIIFNFSIYCKVFYIGYGRIILDIFRRIKIIFKKN